MIIFNTIENGVFAFKKLGYLEVLLLLLVKRLLVLRIVGGVSGG
jgi:hypothetical protein